MISNTQDRTEDTFYKILNKLGAVTKKLSKNVQRDAKINAQKMAGRF